MKTNGNDGAFGFMFENFQQPGLTKRELFAGMALQGFLSNADISKVKSVADKHRIKDRQVVATISVELADALIEALNK